MGIQRLLIKKFLHDRSDHLLLDVRSPAEYNHAHMPGAYNLSLFSDEERKIVGTLYKQQGRQQAIKAGLDFFGPKMKKMVEEVEVLFSKKDEAGAAGNGQRTGTVFIYCWRGGMRSAAIAWLLDMYGFKVFVLMGGYKAYRNEVLSTFGLPLRFRILGGYTGSGKTDLLEQLEKNGALVIDLEKLACHKGSAFGSLNMPPQPGQEMFENLLSQEIWKKTSAYQDVAGTTNADASHGRIETTIWLEDESQRIGNLNIPAGIWENMRASPLVFIEIPFEERLDYIVREYGKCDTDKLQQSTERIAKRLGGLETKQTIEFLEQGNKKEAFRILLHYYDKLYLKALHNRDRLPDLLTRVNCETVSAGNADRISKYQIV